MSTRTIEQVTTEQPLDALIVLGRGNSVENGVSDLSRQNARYAGMLSLNGLIAPDGLVIASGLGPERIPYRLSEASAMAQVIGSINPSAAVEVEDRSTNTFENIYFSSLLLPSSAQRIGIVGTKGHAERGTVIARSWLAPDNDVVPLPTDVHVSVAGLALERVLMGLSVKALDGVEPGNLTAFMGAQKNVQDKIKRVKQSPFKNLHSGRR